MSSTSAAAAVGYPVAERVGQVHVERLDPFPVLPRGVEFGLLIDVVDDLLERPVVASNGDTVISRASQHPSILESPTLMRATRPA
jgi:hypothetical protein